VVFLAFVILPLFIQAGYVLVKSLTEGTKGVVELSKPSPDLMRSHRKLTYGLLSLYITLFVSSLIWVVSELMQGLGQTAKSVVWFAIGYVIIMALLLGFTIKRSKDLRKKFPRPENANHYNAAFREWENKLLDESSKITLNS
jgi:hypothetical protein